MMGYRYGAGGWAYVFLMGSSVVLWVLLGVGVIALVRYLSDGGRQRPGPSTPEEVLAGRFARGELDDAEYRRRLATLRRVPPDDGQPGLDSPRPGVTPPAG